MAVAAGSRLGPYELLEPLGAGGMGEVYRARDPRLSRDVAVKLISTEGTPSADRLRRFETEARAAARLSHPNVVTVYDVGTHEGQPYLVLELLEGETLRETLRGGTPPLRQAVSWALEVSRGLAAAHERGIVHRDLKPENVFLTTDGRVKILDFGLAKLHEPLVSDEADRESPTATKGTSPGVLLGTVGYMSPEQVKGVTPDARTDVFALGAVLYEMVAGRRAFRGETAPEVLASILRDEPPALESVQHGVPASVETVVRRCLAKRPADRYSSGRAVEAALETVLSTLEPSRVSVARPMESRGPYPGLSSFTEADADRFFGRETEVEALWEKLRRGRLLAVIGPSGAGKTSFLRAGLVPSRPSGWGAIVTTPGASPTRGLAEALVGEMPSDPDTMRELLRFDDPEVAYRAVRKWRSAHLETVLIVDQFEELFTQCPPEVQGTFVDLLGRLAKEGDVHVLLSMRDDFLMRCHEQEALVSVFERLTPLGPLSEEGLRRAVTEPARKEGFSFEDESLVGEILESVEGTRGALPLLAFAVARLWGKRDRERKLLTRRAYEEIGGVGGALAQHAEQTLERIGLEKEPIVRELFRNLVTAQWTRAVADREEVLSVLPDPKMGEHILDALIDARLLTSSSHSERVDAEDRPKNLADGEPGAASARTAQRIEIIHESLLRAWPRLVRWQAQDEEGAVLRDQLKQAAHLWEEKGRPDDLLWTGTSEREFELWQDRYPGRLTALESAFAGAMVQRARRSKRVRRLATAVVVVGLALFAGAIAVSRQHALEQARRAEAGKLLALAQTQLADDLTAALAYARGSLELFDTPEARVFAVRALWRGPIARILHVQKMARGNGLPDDPSPFVASFSPRGRWLATTGPANRRILLFSRDGSPPRALPRPPEGGSRVLAFGPQEEVLVTGGAGETLQFWSLPELRETGHADLGGVWTAAFVAGETLYTLTHREGGAPVLFRSWSPPEWEPHDLGPLPPSESEWHVDSGGAMIAYGQGRTVHVCPLDPARRSRDRILGTAGDDVRSVAFAPRGDRLASLDRTGEIRVWSTDGDERDPIRVLRGPPYQGVFDRFDPAGRLYTQYGPNNALWLWDLAAPPESEPLILGRMVPGVWLAGDFDPEGQWLATTYGLDTVEFWPVVGPRAYVIQGVSSTIWYMGFTSDSGWLATCALNQPARLWPLSPDGGTPRDLQPPEPCMSLATHPARPEVLVGGASGEVSLFPTTGEPPRRLGGWNWAAAAVSATLDPEGRRVLASPYGGGGSLNDPRTRVLQVWDLESGQEESVSLADLTGPGWGGSASMGFGADGSLYGTLGNGGDVVRVTLPAEPGGSIARETILSASSSRSVVSPDGQLLLVASSESEGTHNFEYEQLHLFDLARHTSRCITTHGSRLVLAAFGPSGRVIVTGDLEGVVRVGRVTGEEPHLLLGHRGMISSLAVSPDGRWVASASEDAIRLWPMPDITRPPLHALPYEELLARLDALTNLRAVPDPASSTGWSQEVAPFPGWETVPTW